MYDDVIPSPDELPKPESVTEEDLYTEIEDFQSHDYDLEIDPATDGQIQLPEMDEDEGLKEKTPDNKVILSHYELPQYGHQPDSATQEAPYTELKDFQNHDYDLEIDQCTDGQIQVPEMNQDEGLKETTGSNRPSEIDGSSHL